MPRNEIATRSSYRPQLNFSFTTPTPATLSRRQRRFSTAVREFAYVIVSIRYSYALALGPRTITRHARRLRRQRPIVTSGTCEALRHGSSRSGRYGPLRPSGPTPGPELGTGNRARRAQGRNLKVIFFRKVLEK